MGAVELQELQSDNLVDSSITHRRYHHARETA